MNECAEMVEVLNEISLTLLIVGVAGTIMLAIIGLIMAERIGK